MSEVDRDKPADPEPHTATCKECGRKIVLCDHMASNLMMLSSLGDTHTRIADENKSLRNAIAEARTAIDRGDLKGALRALAATRSS